MTEEDAMYYLRLIKRILVSCFKDENGERIIDTKMDEAIDMGHEALKRSKWNPVSERLPRSHGVYQVTIQCEEGRYTSACYFDGSNTWHNDNRINHGRPYATDKVIAWQEEPEPYKAESEDKG